MGIQILLSLSPSFNIERERGNVEGEKKNEEKAWKRERTKKKKVVQYSRN